MESNEMHRILWNAMKIYRILWNALKSIEYCGIQWILHDFVFIDIDFDACRDYRKRPAGPPGAPREPSGAHLTTFAEYVKNATIWIMPFWGLLEQIINIIVVLLIFLRCHFEAILHRVACFKHFTIHLRQELQRVFNDFDIVDNQKKVACFAPSRCV